MRFHVRPVLSALLLIAVVNVSVFAGGAVSSESANSKALLGKLVTTSNRPIMVNGAEAITGAIILSGAQLVTSAASLATVQLDKVGTVTVAPNSSVTLNFDATKLTVRVLSGDATVTTAKGVTGAVLDAAGNPRSAAVPVTPEEARNWGIAGVAVGGGAFIWALIGWNKANDADDAAKAAQAQAAALAAQLAALRACLAGQTASPVKVCTSF